MRNDVSGSPAQSGDFIISSKKESNADERFRIRCNVSATLACWLQYSEYSVVYSACIEIERTVNQTHSPTTLS